MDYLLNDQPVRLLKGKLRLRQVTRLCDDGHQTQVITSRWDLRDIEVAYRMFERWRQENFFKYMREEFLLDALIDYQIRLKAICWRCCGLTTSVSIKRAEPCCMSCSPLQATSASPRPSYILPWLRSAPRIEPAPSRPSARCSTKLRPCSPVLACACGSPCVRHHVSGSPSPAPRSSATPPPLSSPFPDRRRNRTLGAMLCQEV